MTPPTGTPTVAAEESAAPPRRRGGRGVAAAFLAPDLILVGLFLLLPLVWALWLSMQKLESLGGSQFLGINNYADLMRDSTFWSSLAHTVVFTVLTVPVSMALGLGIARLLNTVMPGRALYRTVIFLPLVISGVSTGLMGAWIFDQYNGFVNDLLAAVGIHGPHWQSSPGWAMASLVLMTLWVRAGFNMLIYLAGLQGLDPELYEAASLDGANRLQQFAHLTWPALRPSTFFLLIMDVIYSFQVFDTVFAMTGGGPGTATTTLVTYAYQAGFDEHGMGELGYAAAIGIVIYLITVAFTAVQWRLNRRVEEV